MLLTAEPALQPQGSVWALLNKKDWISLTCHRISLPELVLLGMLVGVCDVCC